MICTTNPILMTKVKNAVKKKLGNGIEFKLRNTIINGDKRGCYGYIKNPENGITVYIDTEFGCCTPMYFRYAKDEKDSTGCHNNWAHNLDELVNGVCEFLNAPAQYQRELAAWGKVG